MNNVLINSGSDVTMTHKEIADLTGSRIDSVKRTIERLAENGVIRLPPLVDFEEINNLGLKVIREYYVFNGEKGKRDSIIVVAQLCPEFTAQLVDRWQELEEERRKPKSQAEIIAAMALANVEQERRINHVENKVDEVAQTVENIKRGSLPAGWIGYSSLKAKLGMSPLKCKTLIGAYSVPTDTHEFLTPDGLLSKREIVQYEPFMAALRRVMAEAERKGTRWFHPAMGLFQVLKWEAK
ncbi:Rha family transcriptional regulator [Pantoea sp. BAV 3049]|uniref:Rha family transcriptional regulator n=1 Tax=Pantoea sp. BAV 3049 TaxID=2654188 RepID=UPI00131CF75B|nr:Rha family transcriptional regulator [Pantoea sp. BAV 3049]